MNPIYRVNEIIPSAQFFSNTNLSKFAVTELNYKIQSEHHGLRLYNSVKILFEYKNRFHNVFCLYIENVDQTHSVASNIDSIAVPTRSHNIYMIRNPNRNLYICSAFIFIFIHNLCELK